MQKRYLLIEMNEGVLEDVLVIEGAKEARKQFAALREEAGTGEGYVDEAHLFEITDESASGVKYMDCFAPE